MQNFEMSSKVVVSGGGGIPSPWLSYETVCLIPPLSRRPRQLLEFGVALWRSAIMPSVAWRLQGHEFVSESSSTSPVSATSKTVQELSHLSGTAAAVSRNSLNVSTDADCHPGRISRCCPCCKRRAKVGEVGAS